MALEKSNVAERPELAVIFPNNSPRAFGALADDIAAVAPPVQAGLIAEFARRAGFSVVLLDAAQRGWSAEETAEYISGLAPLLVLICTDFVNSGDVTKMAAASEMAKAIKSRTPCTWVAMEGVVPTALPEHVLTEEGADFVCCGEAYQPVLQLLHVLKSNSGSGRWRNKQINGIWAKDNGAVIRGTRAEPFRDMENFPQVAWDLMPPSNYRAHHWHCFDCLSRRSPYAAIYTALGCPYNCTYCCANVTSGKQSFRPRKNDDVLMELELLAGRYGTRNIRLLDNVFTARPDRVVNLCERIAAKNYNLNLWAYARIDSIPGPELLKSMRKAGIRWVAYGIESASEKALSAVNKRAGSRKTEEVIEWTRRAGIAIVGNIMFGLPEDTYETMQASLEMAKLYNFEWANFYCAVAYPGTALYQQLSERGMALPKKWSAYSQYAPDFAPLPTAALSSAEIRAFRDTAFVEYYSSPAYLQMIQRKFGKDAVAYVKKILEYRIKRTPIN